jgi:hypothetical protein
VAAGPAPSRMSFAFVSRSYRILCLGVLRSAEVASEFGVMSHFVVVVIVFRIGSLWPKELWKRTLGMSFNSLGILIIVVSPFRSAT